MVYFLEILNKLNQSMYGIPFRKLAIFFLIILSTFVARFILFNVINKKIAKLKIAKSETISIVTGAIKNPLGYLILVYGFYVGIISLELPENIGTFETYSVVHTVYILCISFTILYLAFRVIDIIEIYIDKKVKDKDAKDKDAKDKDAKDKNSIIDEHVAKLITKSLQILVATIGILSIVHNFGYNITSLVAGLGLGGLALALAAQTTISNVFGSATIFSDKPFRIGDIVGINDIKGTVEEIGLRSTRIRMHDQSLAIVPNSKFVNNDIINYSSITKRRIEFYIKITYDTSVYDIKAVVDGTKKIIEEDERFDHSSHIVKFTNFGDWSLDIYVYGLVKITDFAEFQSIKEELNLKIMRLLDDLNVKMAFPSSTIYLHDLKDNK